MSTLSRIKALAMRVEEARRRRHTRRIVEALPLSLRKDIGWPE